MTYIMMKKTRGAITNCRINGDNMVMLLCAIICVILHYINIIICDIFMQTLELQQDVIRKIRIIIIRHVCQGNFMTRQRNLIIILLNGPSHRAFFGLITDIEHVFPHVSRIKISRPVAIDVTQRKFGLDQRVLVGPIHAQFGTIFVAIQKKCTTPSQKYSKSCNSSLAVFAVFIDG